MILVFPDLDTFRLVLTTQGLVPDEAVLTAATVATDSAGRVSVETGVKLSKKAAADLAKLGVTSAKRHVGEPEPVSCWPQILPVERDPKPPQLAATAPVLFELTSPADLPTLVTEMLRLGNDRQSVRMLEGASGTSVLLRVVGPPYYTLLRALDQTASGTTGTVRAFAEAAPRVWVQLGHTHPLAGRVQVPDDQLVLIGPPRDWRFLPEGPFQDVYDLLRFELSGLPVRWTETPAREKVAVPLKLVPGNATDTPELWVLKRDAVEQLDAFVRDADERLTQRLKFAVAADPDGGTVVVLRTTVSKLAPPSLGLPGAVGFKPYYKLPNLYLPAAARLHPTLRRDAVRKLLAEDTDALVWLYPGPDGAFTPETIPEDSFRPLADWVEYVIATNQAPLAAWIDATRFDFESFVCAEGPGGPKPPREKDDGPKGKRRGKADDGEAVAQPAGPADEAAPAPATGFVPVDAERKPSEWEVRRKELETAFLATDGPLDAPDRTNLWPQLAVANAGAGATDDAAICWVNALWPADLRADWVSGWLRTELPSAKLPVSADELTRRMAVSDPTPGEARQFVALLLSAAGQTPPPAWLRPTLPAAQKYLEMIEGKLPLRAVWLASVRLAAVAGSDTLGLTRVRDRLLQRLLDDGLNPEKNLPSFLRYAGLADSDRARQVKERAIELHQAVRHWADASLKQTNSLLPSDRSSTLGYIDLLFAFGLARLGEHAHARRLVDAAHAALGRFTPGSEDAIAAGFLFDAFKFRVEQALAGKPHVAPLAPALHDELARIESKASGKSDNPFGKAHYAIARLLEQSRVLEPQEKLDPYNKHLKVDELRRAVFELSRVRDPQALIRRTRELYRNGVSGQSTPDTKLIVLHDALPLAVRAGEPFTVELIDLVPEAMKATGGAYPPTDLSKKQAHLLERGLFLAAHFDRREVVQRLVDQFIELLQAKADEPRYELANATAGPSLRSLRKLGLRDEIDKLLRRMQDVILGGQPPAKLRERYAGKPELWAMAQSSLLNLAGGWLTFGLVEQAAPILADAEAELLGPGGAKLRSKEYTGLARAFVTAVGLGPTTDGLDRVIDLFRRMDPARVQNGWTTAKFYSRFHLNLVEDTVLSLVSDENALGPGGRRWLDEDEHLIRRRIHQDVRRSLARSGL